MPPPAAIPVADPPYEADGRLLHGRRYLTVLVWLNRQPYQLLVSTGSSATVLLPEIVRDELGLAPPSPAPSSLGLGPLAPVLPTWYPLSQALVGGFPIPQPVVLADDWPRAFNANGALGMDWLAASFGRICLDLVAPRLLVWTPPAGAAGP
jgi:hypothetical protein